MEPVKFLPAGDSAVSVQFGNVIDPAVYQRVHALQLQLDRAKLPGIVEVLPTYRALMVHYDPGILPFAVLVKELNQLIASPFPRGSTVGRSLPFQCALAENWGRTWTLWPNTTTQLRRRSSVFSAVRIF